MPERQINNPTGAFNIGGSWLIDEPNVVGRTVAGLAAGAITAGQVVALSTTEATSPGGPAVVVAATNQNLNSVVGIAIESAVAGQSCEVAVGDGTVVYGASKDTGSTIAQFDRLTISSTTTGGLVTVSAATAVSQIKDVGIIYAVAMVANAVTTGTAIDVMLIRW